jgi:hypothetical protein
MQGKQGRRSQKPVEDVVWHAFLASGSGFGSGFSFSISKVDLQNAAADRRDLPVTSALLIHSVQVWCSR